MVKPEHADDKDQPFLDGSVLHAEAVLAAQDPWDVYRACNAFSDMASSVMSNAPLEDGFLPQLPSDVYVIWAALSDEMDAPGRAGPEVEAAAAAHMKRAAKEWLGCVHDPQARATYLDHWKHVECGYDKTPDRQ
ncbi:MAG: hypothetical protein JJD92_14405 [Frankiaceae bacterium]|nr:hypothetical protein [Frankiaceae bacterium]